MSLDNYITPDELQRRFGYTKQTQASLRKNRKLPFTRFGRYIYYPVSELEKILENNTVSVL